MSDPICDEVTTQQDVCICEHYHAEDDTCFFTEDIIKANLFTPAFEPIFVAKCMHTECSKGCYKSLSEYEMYVEPLMPSWAELFGFKRFHCKTFNITREFV